MRENRDSSMQKCQIFKASQSLTNWLCLINEMADIKTIMEALESMIKRDLIDRNAEESVKISDEFAYAQINSHLLGLGLCVDEIAKELLKRDLEVVFISLIDLVIRRENLEEINLLKAFLIEDRELLSAEWRRYYVGLLHHKLNGEEGENIQADVQSTVDEIWE